MKKEIIKCKRCKVRFKKSDSMGSDFYLCQECWENLCDRAWWQMIKLWLDQNSLKR